MSKDQQIITILSLTLIIFVVLNAFAMLRAAEARGDLRQQYEQCINDLPFTRGPGDSDYTPPGE